MASADCSTCLSLPYDVTRSKFNCRWCQNGCQSQATCSGSALDTCPPPVIHKVGTFYCHVYSSSCIQLVTLTRKLIVSNKLNLQYYIIIHQCHSFYTSPPSRTRRRLLYFHYVPLSGCMSRANVGSFSRFARTRDAFRRSLGR